jgi:hypothetical protein
VAGKSSGFLTAALKLPVLEVSYERIGAERGFASAVLRLTIEIRGREPLTVAFYRKLAGGSIDETL